MSVQLSAPYPINQTITILPNPQWNDSVNLKDNVTAKHAIDGTLYTYIRQITPRRRLLFTFTLTYYKSIELEEFYRTYAGSLIYIKDHLANEWVGYMVMNPMEISVNERAYPGGGSEYATVTLEFEVTPRGQEEEI